MKTLLQRDAPILRQTAKEISEKEIGSPRMKKIIAELKEALASQDDGVAIAGPQIGYSLRIFVVSGKVADIVKKTESPETKKVKDSVYINPIITKLSKEKRLVEEGCLSVRFLYGKVRRSAKATVQAFDENGKKVTVGASGLLAQIFQHETDHLNGELFIDKAKNVSEIIPEHLSNNTRNEK